MTVAAALTFIRRARADPAIRAALECASEAAATGAICAIGADHGLAFSESDFDRAFAIEWTARWAHFGNPDTTIDKGGKGK
ncbi:Nif11-like leader peptide family natural product precursor [Sphingomonas sp. LB-2]|uniref:Nif11-like leader peptide family natural product precursor n=1 Tax=Sphingomonas caeni TaxID=2984949 RepID=UPI00222E7C6F|nr:Nif11-like leader peptide family natural product precursor [Sphingomonas caeni]MCW3846662.1 Nif11-like leader peptide family natural product precursor [Sphingomonas caeni]